MPKSTLKRITMRLWSSGLLPTKAVQAIFKIFSLKHA